MHPGPERPPDHPKSRARRLKSGQAMAVGPVAVVFLLPFAHKLTPGKNAASRKWRELLLVLLGLNHFLAAVEAGRADVVTASNFTSRRFDGESRVGKKVMSTTIATAGSRFFILLNSHFKTPR